MGDVTSFDNPDLFVMSMVWDQDRPNHIIAQAQEGKFRDLILAQNEDNQSWTLDYYCYIQKQRCSEIFNHNISASDLEQKILENMWTEDLYKIACEQAIIMPVLYQNKEICTQNTETAWHRDQIGYIFASYDEVEKLFGEVTKETLEKAKGLIEEELKIQSQYDKGNLFGYRLFRGDHQMAENWGYLGESQLVAWKIQQDLPKELQHMVDSLEYVDQKEVDEFLCQGNEEEWEEDR